MPPKSNVPIRIGGSKVRTGCRTCKRRHLKCDERRPVCLRCEKVKLECSYELSRSPSPETPTELSTYGGRNTNEVVAVRNFIKYLGPELAGCFPDSVWCSTLPRIAQHEAVIWDSIVAVSTLSTSIRLGQSPGLALRHYDKAVQALRQRLTSPGKSQRSYRDVVLLACLLFTIFECLQNNIRNALQHMIAGMQLLRQWEPDETDDGQEAYLSRAALEPFFMNLDSQAIQMAPVGFRDYGSSPAIDQPPRPHYTSFESIEEAHLALNRIFNRMSHWSQWIPPSVATSPGPDSKWLKLEEQLLGIQLAEWDEAFSPLLRASDTAALLPLVQRTVIQIFYNKDIDGRSEMEWDKYMPQFEKAVQYAEAYMQTIKSPSSSSSAAEVDPAPKRPVFTTSTDMVLSLFLITSRCRNPLIRRRALAILKSYNRKEALWDSSQAARVCERVIEIEENSTLEDEIPERFRVAGMDVTISDEGSVNLVYRRGPMEGDDSDSVILAQDNFA